MKFFIPGMEEDAEKAEKVYQATRQFATDTTGVTVTDKRIYAIQFERFGKTYQVKVGEPSPPQIEEPILVILEANLYLVCTFHRGVVMGAPMRIGKEEVKKITEFDE